jgi:hypothetical protein
MEGKRGTEGKSAITVFSDMTRYAPIYQEPAASIRVLTAVIA